MRKNTEDSKKNKCKDAEGRERMVNQKNCKSRAALQGTLGGKINTSKGELVQ